MSDAIDISIPALMEYAPNGTHWPLNHEPVKDTRLIWVKDIVEAAKYCTPSLKDQWDFKPYAKILACTIGKDFPRPFLVLPKTLPDWAIKEGWTVDLLKRYEQANADGVTTYAKDGPARRKK